MSSDGTRYDDSMTRYLSAEEQARGLAAIDRLETAWLFDPAHAEDMQRLHVVRSCVVRGSLQLGELAWLRNRIRGAG